MLDFVDLQAQSALVCDVFRCLLRITPQFKLNLPFSFLHDMAELLRHPLWALSVLSRKGDPRVYLESDRGSASAEFRNLSCFTTTSAR